MNRKKYSRGRETASSLYPMPMGEEERNKKIEEIRKRLLEVHHKIRTDPEIIKKKRELTKKLGYIPPEMWNQVISELGVKDDE